MGIASWPRALAAVALLGALSAAAPAAETKKDPAGTALVMGEMRATFAEWDLNNDGFLDKQELAKAFRGKDAKPYDAKPAGKADKDKPKDGDKPKDADKGAPKDGDPGKGSVPGATKPDYSKYPDYAFLVRLDVNGDGKVSRDEFINWAREYAVQEKKQVAARQRVQAAEAKVAAGGKLTQKEQQTLQKDLKKEQEALAKIDKALSKHMMGFEKQLKQHLSKHGKKK